MTFLKNIFTCLACQGNIEDYENEYEPADEESSSEEISPIFPTSPIPPPPTPQITTEVKPFPLEESQLTEKEDSLQIREDYPGVSASYSEPRKRDRNQTEITRRYSTGPIYVRDYSPPTYHRHSTALDPYIRSDNEWILG